MTPSAIKNAIAHAKSAANRGDCDLAQSYVQHAEQWLDQYSGSAHASLYRALTNVQATVDSKCDPDRLAVPTWRSPAASSSDPDSLLTPSFRGASDTEGRDTIFAVIGMVVSIGLVGLGFHAAKR